MVDKECCLLLFFVLKNYLLLKFFVLCNVVCISVMLSVVSLMGNVLYLFKFYWILMMVFFVIQNGYGVIWVCIVYWVVGMFVGLMIVGFILYFYVLESYILSGMLLIILFSYLIICKYYGWVMVGFMVMVVYILQLLMFNGEQFIIVWLIDIFIGCLIVFGGMVWLWLQWQSGLLKKNVYDVLEVDQQVICLIFSVDLKVFVLVY